MLVDTDVIIWFLRGNQLAEARLNQIPKLRLSVITYMELVQGILVPTLPRGNAYCVAPAARNILSYK